MGAELLGITLTGWVSLTVAVSVGVLGLMMFILGTERLHYVWGLFSAAVSIWTGAFFFVSQAPDATAAIFWWKITYIGIILIPFAYFHFVLELTKRVNAFAIVALYVLAAVLIFLNLTTNLMINEVSFMFNELYYNHPPGLLHPFFLIFFVSLVTIAHYFGYVVFRTSTDDVLRQRTWIFFLATGIGFIGATMNFLGVYGIAIHPSTNFTAALAPPVIAFAILKYRLFDIKVVLAQILTLVLVAFTVFRLVLSQSLQELLFNLLFLSVTLVVGVYLVRSVKNEVEQREEIERLAKDLQKANERLKELDKMKSQFLSIASHDLRAPLTAIRNFMSLLLDGTYGTIPPAAREGMEHVFDRATEMAESVSDYLNISRIEQGRMKYDFVESNLYNLLSDSVEVFRPNFEKEGLTLTVDFPEDKKLLLKADIGKLQEVFNNLLDNAIKYTPKGTVSVSLEKVSENKARIIFEDTGTGMDEKTIKSLFKLFSTGENSRKINASSTGIGLYITKAHVEAHGGRVWAESDGEGKGSRFIVELPLKA